MTKWGRQGNRLLVTVLVAVGIVVSTAPAAFAHGDQGPAPAALSETAGPYVVSVWIEEITDRTMTTTAVIEGRRTDAVPEVWLQSGQGRASLRELVVGHDGNWTVEFHSVVGDSIVVGWATTAGAGELVIALDELAVPWWFRPLLVLITVPGLWFAQWLLKRRRRAFGLAPAPV